MKNARRSALRVRRSPHLVFYWRDDRLIVRNYATGAAAVIPPLACLLLDYCGRWRTTDDIRRLIPLARPAAVAKFVRQLVARSFLQTSDRPEPASERAMRALEPWNPEAGFFHTATKDVRFWSPEESAREARALAKNRAPVPPAVKAYRGVPTIRLPAAAGSGAFGRIALQRRTWRRFSAAPVTRAELATVLGLSAGVQQWMRVGPRMEVPLKTSPSGGARHPIECYVVARNVTGVPAGLYHYSAGRHELARLRAGATAAQIRSYLPHSGYFGRAAVLVLFTAMYERQLWRYPYSRAYRAALIEAGHVCQTFCLASTALGLAPFSVMALADSRIERDLGIDGITETVLYAAGMGRPPAGSTSAPRPRGTVPVRPNVDMK